LDRHGADPPGAGESYFSYLNRSARKSADAVRQLLEDWVDRYPESHRGGLVARLRSPDDDVHLSAFFELALHELLIKTGCLILEVEPRLSNSPRSPDFLVEDPDGARFYLEAVLATGRSKEETSRQRRLSAALLAVEAVNSDRHYLDVKTEGKPSQPIRLKSLRRRLQEWVDRLPDGAEASELLPFEHEEHGLKLTIGAFPRRSRAGGADPRSIGMLWGVPFVGTPGDDIREAIKKKANRYGSLDAPYVVAVNSLREFDDEEDTIAALFGSPCVVFRTFDDGRLETFESRNWDGVWVDESGPRKVGLSAVLSAHRLRPWSVGQRRACLIRNPWAERHFPPYCFGSDSYSPVGNELMKEERKGLAEIFELPAGWPGED
jgi:hypothetical protein